MPKSSCSGGGATRYSAASAPIAMPWPGAASSGCSRPLAAMGDAVDEERFEASVVDEPLDVPQIRRRRRNVSVQRGGAVRGNLQIVRLRENGAAEPPGVPAAAGDIELQAVHHRAQPVDVIKVVGVFPGGHVAVHRAAHRGRGR